MIILSYILYDTCCALTTLLSQVHCYVLTWLVSVLLRFKSIFKKTDKTQTEYTVCQTTHCWGYCVLVILQLMIHLCICIHIIIEYSGQLTRLYVVVLSTQGDHG